jgi:hypothetical protein
MVVSLFVLIGFLGWTYSTGKPNVAGMSDEKEVAPSATESVAPSGEAVGALLFLTPTSTPEILTEFQAPQQRLLWQDTFDSDGSGWHAFQTTQGTDGNVSWTKYHDGGYEIVTNSLDHNVVWDVNEALVLPMYPYLVDVQASATRDAVGVIIVDYHGDPRNISLGSGLFVTLDFRNPPSDEDFTERIWEASPTFPKDTSAFRVYESVAGLNWELNCTGRDNLVISRNGVFSIYVDVNAVLVVQNLNDGEPRNSMMCTRIPNRPVQQNGRLGLARVRREQLSPNTIQQTILRFETMSISTLEQFPTVEMPPARPSQRSSSCYETHGNLSDISVILSDDASYHYAECVGADIASTIHTATRYPSNVENLIGTWQCGPDEENRFEFRWNGTHIQAVFSDTTYQLVTLEESLHTTNSTTFVLATYLSQEMNKAIQPGDRLIHAYPYQMVPSAEKLMSNWAGDCTRQ